MEMTMDHKEALEHASKIYFATMPELGSNDDMEAAIRAYIDARGLVMVPKVPNDDMHVAGRNANVGPRSPAHGYIYTAMLAAAPDPFGDAE